MEHSEAVKLHATERYLLGELGSEQRDQFEEHYFSCPECAADLKAAASLMAGARRLLRTGFVPARAEKAKRDWFLWFRPAYAMAAAALLLLAIFAYQNLATIPRLERRAGELSAPQALASFSLVNAASRAAGSLIIRTASNRPFGLYVDIPPGASDSYICEIRDESGRARFAVSISAEQAKETVQLLVPASQLESGRYEVAVFPAQAGATASARFPFILQLTR